MKLKGLFSYFYSQKYADTQENTYKLYGYDEKTDTYPVVFSMNNPVLKRNVYRKEELKGQLQLTYNKTFGLHGIDAVASVESFKKDNPYLIFMLFQPLIHYICLTSKQWIHSMITGI